MFDINKHPSRRDLAVFAALLPVMFAIVGAFRFHAGSTGWAVALWVIGFSLGAWTLVVPAARRWLYVGWMYAMFPLAWTVSQLILAGIYFIVATPIALVLRAFRVDPLQRKLDRAADSYWLARERSGERDPERYFRQF